MANPVVYVSGAGGFIGSALVRYLEKIDFTVISLTQKQDAKNFIPYDLEKKLSEEQLISGSVIYHTAVAHTIPPARGYGLNVKAAEDLISLARKKNLHVVFLSSFSAHRGARSVYGKSKLEIENLFLNEGHAVAKLGLVLGNGGLFKMLSLQVSKGKPVPLVEGNKILQTVLLSELLPVLAKIGVEKRKGLFHLAETGSPTMGDFYREISAFMNVKPFFIPVSSHLLLLAAKILESFGLKSPVSSESILGLQQLRFFETKQDLEKLGIQFSSMKESLMKLKNEPGNE